MIRHLIVLWVVLYVGLAAWLYLSSKETIAAHQYVVTGSVAGMMLIGVFVGLAKRRTR